MSYVHVSVAQVCMRGSAPAWRANRTIPRMAEITYMMYTFDRIGSTVFHTIATGMIEEMSRRTLQEARWARNVICRGSIMQLYYGARHIYILSCRANIRLRTLSER